MRETIIMTSREPKILAHPEYTRRQRIDGDLQEIEKGLQKSIESIEHLKRSNDTVLEELVKTLNEQGMPQAEYNLDIIRNECENFVGLVDRGEDEASVITSLRELRRLLHAD